MCSWIFLWLFMQEICCLYIPEEQQTGTAHHRGQIQQSWKCWDDEVHKPNSWASPGSCFQPLTGPQLCLGLPFLQLMLPMRKGPIALNSWMHPFSESVGCSGLLLHFLMLLLYAYNVAPATSSAETTLVTVTNLRHFQSHIWNSVWRLDQHTRARTEHQCWKEGCRFGSDWLQRERLHGETGYLSHKFTICLWSRLVCLFCVWWASFNHICGVVETECLPQWVLATQQLQGYAWSIQWSEILGAILQCQQGIARWLPRSSCHAITWPNPYLWIIFDTTMPCRASQYAPNTERTLQYAPPLRPKGFSVSSSS